MDYIEEDAIVDIICQTASSEFFDQVIGHIEDIILSEQFQALHDNFLEKYWSEFEDTEENKFKYTDIFEEYTNSFETFFMEELNKRMENFEMDKFATELITHEALQEPLGFGGSEIFELLHSFGNFQTFKELMLDYRNKKEGHVQHLDFDILTTKPLNLCEFPRDKNSTCLLKQQQN